MIYVSAIYATADESMVTGADAEGNSETVPADFSLFRQPDDGPLGYIANGGTIAPYVAPEPAPIIPHLNNGGLARFTGAAPASMLENIRMSGVTRVAKGRYRVTHTTAMPSDQYSVTPSVLDANPRSIRVTARTASYVEVRVIDAAGVAQDATEITVMTERVIS